MINCRLTALSFFERKILDVIHYDNGLSEKSFDQTVNQPIYQVYFYFIKSP
ncbi:hypothetical protein [Oceanobacillus caeni]|uniref:hypothetical protein n=1 Tax=Oceanobacillus caeni TaxID=405946 RepID=UPI001785709D